MYKQIGNSVYGQVSSGLSGKKTFDARTNSYVKREGGSLSNPILASYITGFTRAIVGECLNNIDALGGRVVSVTTDGFITNICDLESIILEKQSLKAPCLKLFRDMRRKLTENLQEPQGDDALAADERLGNDSALEVKFVENRGLIS